MEKGRCLKMDLIALAMGKRPGGSFRYEPVAHFAFGEMTGGNGLYQGTLNNVKTPILLESETYYLNGEDMPSTSIGHRYIQTLLGFNIANVMELFDESIDSIDPIDPSKPWYVLMFALDNAFIVSNTNTLANTTVRLLRKVPGEDTYAPFAQFTYVEMDLDQSTGLYVASIGNSDALEVPYNTVYFNDAMHPMSYSPQADRWLYNINPDGTLKDETKPGYGLQVNLGSVYIISSEDLSGETVTFLREERSEETKIAGDYTIEFPIELDGDDAPFPAITLNRPLADIYRAAQRGENVQLAIRVHAVSSNGFTRRFFCVTARLQYAVETWIYNGDRYVPGYRIAFAALDPITGDMKLIRFDDSQSSTFEELMLGHTSSHGGKLLGVNSEGALEWVAPQ